MRLYFHLTRCDEVLQDQEGVEVVDLHTTCAETVRALEELRQEDPTAVQDWAGWTLNVTEGSRAVVLSLDLNRDTAFPSLPQ
jgi:CelD/BcsL family acetyltransferase involved in cellulose biosynthesis